MLPVLPPPVAGVAGNQIRKWPWVCCRLRASARPMPWDFATVKALINDKSVASPMIDGVLAKLTIDRLPI